MGGGERAGLERDVRGRASGVIDRKVRGREGRARGEGDCERRAWLAGVWAVRVVDEGTTRQRGERGKREGGKRRAGRVGDS